MIAKLYFFGLIFVAVISLLYSILFFSGKGVIFSKDTKEERKKMSIKAYRMKYAILALLLAILSLVNALRFIFAYNWITYLSIAIFVAIIVFYIVSSHVIKNNNK